MTDLVHFVKSDSAIRSHTETSATEETNYTVSWANLTGAGFANGDNVAIIVLLGLYSDSASDNVNVSVRVGSSFAGASELPGGFQRREPGSGARAGPFVFIDDYALVTDDNIYIALWTTTSVTRTDDFAIIILNRDDIGATNYQYAETTPSGDAAVLTTDGAQLSLAAGNWWVTGMTQWLDDSISADMAMDIYTAGLGASLATDNFNGTEGTELATYNSTWIQHGFSTTTAEIAANRIRHTANGQALYYYNSAPSSPDYSISADLYVASLHASEAAGICGRIVTGANTFYQIVYEYGTTWMLYRVVAGTSTSIGTYAQVLTAGNTYNVKLEMVRNNLTVYVDGAQIINVLDNNILTTGYAGIRIGYASGATPSDSTLYHLDNFEIKASDSHGYVRIEGEDTGNTPNHGAMTYLALSDTKTVTARYWVDAASTHDCIKTKLMAINLAAFNGAWGSYSDAYNVPDVVTTWEEVAANNSYSKSSTGAMLALSVMSVSANGSTFGMISRVQQADANWPASSTWGSAQSSDNTNCIIPKFAFGYLSSLAAGTYNFDFDYQEVQVISGQFWDEISALLIPLELASAGGTIYTVTVTDGIMFNDIPVKDTASTKADSLLIGDNRSSLLEKILAEGLFIQDTGLQQKVNQYLTTDYLALSDTAFIQKLTQMLVTDSILITDSRVTAIDKQLLDSLFLYDAMSKVAERVRQDSLLLGDSVAFVQGIGSQIYTILVTDGLMLIDSMIKQQETTKRDSLLVTDNISRGTDRHYADGVLISDNMIKDRQSTLRDSLLLGDSRFMDTARILIDRLLVGDRLVNREIDLNVMDRVLLAELVTRAREIVLREGLFLYDSVATSVTEAIVAALIYARLTMTDLLSITASSDDPLGTRLDEADPLGIQTGFHKAGWLQ